MRSFIAIELSKEIKDFLGSLQDKLKQSGADVKWVEPKNIHLTLKFLGEIKEEKVDKVKLALEESLKDRSCFYMQLGPLGCFPNTKFPRVIWIGIKEGDIETRQITEYLEEKMAKIGIPKENRPFSSHITIGRVRSGLNIKNLIASLDTLTANLSAQVLPGQTVNKIILFKSTLTPKGPIYEPVKEASLKTI